MSHSTDWAADENSSAVHQDVQAAAESFKIFLKVWNIFSLEISDRQSHGLLAAALQCEVLDQSDDISVNIIVSCWWAHWVTRDLLTPALSRHNEHIPLVALSDVSWVFERSSEPVCYWDSHCPCWQTAPPHTLQRLLLPAHQSQSGAQSSQVDRGSGSHTRAGSGDQQCFVIFYFLTSGLAWNVIFPIRILNHLN